MGLFLHVLAIVFPVFAVIGAGYGYGRRINPDMSVANRLNIDVFCPALVFSSLSAKGIEFAQYQNIAIIGALIVLLSGIITFPISRLLRVNWRTFVPPTMFSNSGNLGVPIILFAFGDKALPIAVLLFVVENTLHFLIGIQIVNPRSHPLKTLVSPMVLAAILGITFSVLNIHLWQPLAIAIEMIGQISIPLLLFSLGVRLFQLPIQSWRLGVIAGVLTPLSGLIILAICLPFFTLSASETAILFVFACLPPAVLNYMVAERYNQDPAAVASITMVGNLLSLITMPLSLAYCFTYLVPV